MKGRKGRTQGNLQLVWNAGSPSNVAARLPLLDVRICNLKSRMQLVGINNPSHPLVKVPDLRMFCLFALL